MDNHDERPSTTTLLQLVEAVSDAASSDRETARVIERLLQRRRFLIAGDPASFERRVASLKPH
jgi:hypothetical protein